MNHCRAVWQECPHRDEIAHQHTSACAPPLPGVAGQDDSAYAGTAQRFVDGAEIRLLVS
jgi:hypothetical protein